MPKKIHLVACARLLFVLVLLGMTSTAFGQGSTFTYQGRLTDGATPPNCTPASCTYDLQFKLFDSPTVGSGTQIGPTLTFDGGTGNPPAVLVTNGIFTVQLDFGASAFPGANRFLDIGVKHPADSSYTPLSPRQPLTSTPYALKSLNATNADIAANSTQLGGVAANQYVITSDPRMSDARTPTPGSTNYIQNRTSPPQASNFNITGDGTVGGTVSGNAVNAFSEFDLGGRRFLTGSLVNIFAGDASGIANTSGADNSFFGRSSGFSNTIGTSNSFFGAQAGVSNVSGNSNSYFGASAGLMSTSGPNSFFGAGSGISNTIGTNNSFFGWAAGNSNTTGQQNTFIGTSGRTNVGGSNNTTLGYFADVASGNLNFATAIGAGSTVATSNTLVLGRSNGSDTVQVPGALNITGVLTANGSGLTNLNAGNVTTGTLTINRGGTGLSSSGASGNFLRSNGSTWTSSSLLAADLPATSGNYIQNTTSAQSSSNFNISGNGLINGRLGIGTPSPGFKVEVIDSSNAGLRVQTNATGGKLASFGGNGDFQIDAPGIDGGRFTVTERGNVGIGTGTPTSSLHVIGATPPPVSSGNGTNASPVLQVVGGNGGATADSGFVVGGNGASAITQAGNGADGDFGGAGGDVSARGGDGAWGISNGGHGGSILLQGGAGQRQSRGGMIMLQGGAGGTQGGSGGSISLQGGIGSNSDGQLLLQPTRGDVEIAGGKLKVFANGEVSINGASITGTSTPDQKLTLSGNGLIRALVNAQGTGSSNAGFGLNLNGEQKWSMATTSGEFQIYNEALGQNAIWITPNNKVGIGNPNPADKLNVNGNVSLLLASGGSTFVCQNSSFQLATCSSSIRYKKKINPFNSGLSLINRLRPVSFNWKANNEADMGLVAEDVAEVEPLLVTHNNKGEIEGVKYDRVGVVLINAVNEQQAQIEKQQKLIEIQQQQIEALKKLVCATNRNAAVCQN